jgi:serine/threonine protein kinase
METPDPAAVQLAVGSRYEVLDLAGAGGMGAVFRARHRELDHWVAIKVLPPEIATSRVRWERFRREAQLAAQLAHPNIVPVYEFEQRQGLTFLIMPFVRGRSLQSVLHERSRLPLPEVLTLLEGVAAALDFAHQRGVVHRDVKPGNMLVEDGTRRTLLTDFGVALTRSSAASPLTAPGVAIGTPEYMAPEQTVAVERVDGRADLYALAVVAYEALTAALPTAGLDRSALAEALHASRPDVPAPTARALVAPLAERPSERPDSAGAWLTAARQTLDRRRPVGWGVALLLIALAAVGLLVLRSRPAARPPAVAVMPFTVLGTAPYPARQLPEYFLSRFRPVPRLGAAMSFRRVRALTGPQPVSAAEGDSIAAQLGAQYFINASVAFAGRSATIAAVVYQTGRPDPRVTVTKSGPVDSISALMDAVWADILGTAFRPNPYATIPRGKDAITAFLNADDAFRRGDYERARSLYDTVVAHDPGFALAYLRRMLALAQVAPDEDSLRLAMRGARRHLGGLERSDSLLLEGYDLLVTRGDGRAAVTRFREAAQAAADPTWARFVAGEFYLYFGQLFDEPLDSARAAFDDVLRADGGFAAALANSISLAHLRGDDAEARRLIQVYRRIDSTSIVADVVGLADTLLFSSPAARVTVLRTLDRRPFTVLVYLAFQAAQFGTEAERHGPERRVLEAMARRARTDRERTMALRFGVAADLREGWTDSARARLNAAPPATAPERDQWVLLASTLALAPLGDAAAARRRLETEAATDGGNGVTLRWVLALSDPARAPPALGGSAPLPASLALDLAARSALARGDTTTALRQWDAATRHYAVLATPFGLVASLWPLRSALARVAIAAADTTRAARACRTFTALIGFVDQAVWTDVQRRCAPWRGAALE